MENLAKRHGSTRGCRAACGLVKCRYGMPVSFATNILRFIILVNNFLFSFPVLLTASAIIRALKSSIILSRIECKSPAILDLLDLVNKYLARASYPV